MTDVVNTDDVNTDVVNTDYGIYRYVYYSPGPEDNVESATSYTQYYCLHIDTTSKYVNDYDYYINGRVANCVMCGRQGVFDDRSMAIFSYGYADEDDTIRNRFILCEDCHMCGYHGLKYFNKEPWWELTEGECNCYSAEDIKEPDC